jgi:heme oxygenase
MNNNFVMAETFLERLRAATAKPHTELEALPVSVSITNPEITKEDYTAYLMLMHDVVKDTEDNIFPELEGIITDLSERRKKHLIENDLLVLNAEAKGNNKPLSSHLDNPSKAFLLGIFYVIEGSALGGRVILKNVKEKLGYNEDGGARYFSGYGTKTGSCWKNFIAEFTKYEEENNCEGEIIKGAHFAFTAIKNHLA